ncbi:MAG: hypothetical protein J3K34DRAFT_514584 [Monoraphidium minutum]|nr:MAG: hypothetical protein J3K34DRAFT_514584 [Monoraphidium minutum]
MAQRGEPSPLVEFPLNDPAYENNITSIEAALTINALIGLACILGFLMARTFTKEYHLRALMEHVTIRPPELPIKGLRGAVGWLKVLWCTSDVWLLHSAGLDALVLQKSHALGFQLFLPIAILGCCLLMPLQISEAYENGDQTFSRLTMANIDPDSDILWAHWLCVFIFLGWTMLLLEWHFREYVSLRQFYLRGVDGYNYWRELHMAEADGVGIHRSSRFAEVVETARLDAIMKTLGKDNSAAPINWWRRKMAWLTSWTGTGSAEDVVELAQELTASDANSDIIRTLRSRTLSIERAVNAARHPRPHQAGAQPHGRHHSARAARRAAAKVLHLSEAPLEDVAEVEEGEAAEGAAAAEGAPGGQAAPGAARAVGEGRDQEQVDGAQQADAPSGSAADQGGAGPGAASGGGAADGGHVAIAVCDDTAAAADQPAAGGAPRAALEEVAHIAAPKWWSTVDVVTTEDGKLRRLTEDEAARYQGNNILLAKARRGPWGGGWGPSVRYRKTINTVEHGGRPVAVHAQQYAVLVTNVNQPVYQEYHNGGGSALGAGACGAPKVKHGDDDVWMGSRYRRLAQAAALGNEAALHAHATPSRVPSALAPLGSTLGDVVAAMHGVEAVQSLEAAEEGHSVWPHPHGLGHGLGHGGARAGSSTLASAPASLQSDAPSSAPPSFCSLAPEPGRARELWGAARAAMVEGRLRALSVSEDYSVVGAVFSALFPGDYDRVVPVFNFREADLLMREWDARVGELELAEHAVRLGGRRRTVTPRGASAPVDRIEWLRAEVARLERAVLEARERALVYNSTPSFFAAAIAASCNIHPLRKQLFKVHPAPGPEEVNWEALWFTHAQRVRRGFYVTPFIITLVLLPVSMLTRWREYCDSSSPVFSGLRAALTGFVPALLIQLWQGLLMPRCVFFAAQSEARHYSLSELDRRMGTIYFLWSGLNFFVGGVVGSTGTALTKTVPELVHDPLHTPETLGYFLPASSKFFFSYMILRTFMSIPLRFLIPQAGVWQAWIRIALRRWFKTLRDDGVPERTAFMRRAIHSPQYGIEYGGNICLVVLICFAFAVICPLIPLFGVAFMAGEWLYWRYQLIYSCQRKYESGGLFFPFLADRVMISAAVMVAFTGCVMIIKSAWAQATLMWAIGLVSLYAYYRRTRDLYIHGMREMPLLVAQMAPRARVPATVYVPPPLQANGLLWSPEHNKPWEFAGLPGYSL